MKHFFGRIIWTFMAAIAFYILGFASVGWEQTGDEWIGLWMNCSAGSKSYSGQHWHTATQVMMTIGLFFLVCAMIALFFIYRKFDFRQRVKELDDDNKKRKRANQQAEKQDAVTNEPNTEPVSEEENTKLWVVFFVLTFLAVLFMLIGFILYGLNHNHQLHWSFVFCVIGAGLCLSTFVYGLCNTCSTRGLRQAATRLVASGQFEG